MIRYRFDIFDELKKCGFSQTRIQSECLLSGQTIQNIRNGKDITTETLNRLCLMLRLQPSDIIEIVPSDEEKLKYF